MTSEIAPEDVHSIAPDREPHAFAGAASAGSTAHRAGSPQTMPRCGRSSPASCWRCSSPRSNRPSSRRRCRRSAKAWAVSTICPGWSPPICSPRPPRRRLFGKLSDIYGRRVILLTAIAIFIAGSVACALAPSIWMLILGRGLQGIGGGGLLPIGADHHRRFVVAARTPGRAGPHLNHVHDAPASSARCWAVC